jgi:serine/threonine-protein kinase PknG
MAIAATAELRGARDVAAHYYETVWRTDHSYVSAAFGLARQRVHAGDRAGAITALDQVPTDSAHFTPAAATAIEILLDGRTPENLDEQTLLDAGKRAAAAPGIDRRRQRSAAGSRRGVGLAAGRAQDRRAAARCGLR